ncbi:MAG TPA: S8 family serine peptidase [Candidatus Krumholzibacteria bacterium]|nr:S8 family serine peptidase [Candidatus Krumholzibacteria bacterium]HPD72494.1 S8 family serine peptidase [Candidatus Krumholzibacteria bacterium]HRY40574.1 S8 family serine peptidase [Candidatus Krumholzibacteria bacterium]
MRQAKFVALAAIALFAAAAAQAGTMSPSLQELLAATPADQPVSVIVHLEDQAPVAAISRDLDQRRATLRTRHEEIVRALKDAALNQEPLLADLGASRARGGVLGFTSYWISNLVVVLALPGEIERLADRPDVAWIEPNFEPELIEPVEARSPAASEEETGDRGIGVAPGITAIRAPEVWSELGINGTGALIGSLDTGVDGDHPALAARWRGNFAPYGECWLDVIGSDPTFPSDFNSHGTHTVGTMCGLAPDDTIGVSPGSLWISCNAIDQGASSGFDSDIIQAFQWFADPDGDPFTNDDVPDVVQNSWGVNENFTGYVDCDSRWWAVIDNCEAAGVVVTWSAGNEGPSAGTLRSPADRAASFYNTFSVGSTIYSPPYTISSFSSRGPSTCLNIPDPAFAIKPEVSAPGSDIYSSVPGGSYGYKSGTSMAGPHVAGVVALMRSANPDLPVDLVKQILMDTAVDLGTAGEDNTYGWGFIDAYAAVLAAMEGFGTLEGHVTNASFGNQPLAGARVELPARGYTYNTDQDGFYSGLAAPETYQAICSLPGFADVEVTVVINPDEVTTQDFQLTDIAGPAISNVTEPLTTTDTAGPYAIAARITDPSTVVSASLIWRAGDGSYTTAAMAPIGGDVYEAEIPGQPANSAIQYYVTATDGVGLESASPLFELLVTQSAYLTDAEDPGDPAWQLGQAGDAADAGLWVRADPVGTNYNGLIVQPEDDHTLAPGVACFVTANGTAGGAAGDADVDHGCTTLRSPTFDLSQADRAFVTYWRWYGEGGNSTDDDWVVEASDDGGTTWVELERVPGNANAWQQVAVELGALDGGSFSLTDQVVLRFLACDLNTQGLVEAAIDDVELTVFNGDISTPVEDVPAGPLAVLLHQNIPNPFNPATTIAFALPAASEVELAVFAIDGRRVATLLRENLSAGEHQATWDGRDASGRQVASGAYFYRLTANGRDQVKRMVLVK